METNMFTDEQLEILRKGFQAHDFTQSVSLSPEYDRKKETEDSEKNGGRDKKSPA